MMKTKRCLFALWTFLSLDLAICAVDPRGSPLSGRKGPGPHRPSPRGAGRPPHGSPATSSPPAATRSTRHGEPRAHLPDVSVTCSTSDFVLRVRPAFYGLGAEAAELALGDSCSSNGVLQPHGDLLFTYPLTACGAVRQSRRGHLVYKFVLHYLPSPKRFPGRPHRVDVDIECRFQRNHHVHQLTVQPTWDTAVVRKRLKGRPRDFQVELMDDSWGRPAQALVYHLGRKVNIQVSAPHLPAGGKLYISSCYAADSKSSLKYTIIDNFGCMLDSKRDPGASQFISRTDGTVRFSLTAFQFTSDPDTEVHVHCLLFVSSEDLSPAQKSCSYKGNRWKALTGDDSICECCDSQCVTSKPRRAMMEGSAVTESLLVSDQPYTAEDGFLPISPTSVSMSRAGEATIIHYLDELHSQEKPWRSADIAMFEEEAHLQEDGEESGDILSMREPDLEDLGFMERIWEKIKFEGDGSGYVVEEEGGYGRREDEISEVQQLIQFNRTKGEMSEQMLPSEVSLPRELQLVSEGEEEHRKHPGRGEDDRMMASEVEWKNEDLVDNREMTWYFTWR